MEKVTFKGFKDWVPVFTTGDHTDSLGRSRRWCAADLEQVVANFDKAAPPPAVPGHPADDAPRLAEVSALRVFDDQLQARFDKVEPVFADIVRSGELANRSVALTHDDKGWKLRHVGFLGVSPPALDNLPAIEFDEDEDVYCYEMDWQQAVRFDSLHQILTWLREWIIDKHSRGEADRVVPRHALARDAASDAEIKEPQFKKEEGMSNDYQERSDFEAARQALAKERSDFEAEKQKLAKERRLDACAYFVREAVKAGTVTPAQAVGMAEFMAAMPEAEFRFSRSEKTVNKGMAEWFNEFIKALPRQVPIGDSSAAFGAADSALDLSEQTAEYMREHPHVSAAEAVMKVNNKEEVI